MTPHKCPVCGGHGTVSKPPWIAGDQMWWIDTQTGPYQCQACCGTGIIWEGQMTCSCTAKEEME